MEFPCVVLWRPEARDCRVLISPDLEFICFSCEVAWGGATRKVQKSRGLGLGKRVAAGRRALGHPRRLVGDMANGLAISSLRFPYSNGFRMPLLQSIRPQADVHCI